MLRGIIRAFQGGATPPVHSSIQLAGLRDRDEDAQAVPARLPAEFQSVAGLACVIDYADADGVCTKRLITCKTFEVNGERASVCAVCHVRKAYRRFVLDRIEAVYDPVSAVRLGSGDFFRQFDPDHVHAGADTWGLSRSRKQTLLAGLNILAFMGRCDGAWHMLEEPVLADFVARLWELKGWEGEPPMCAIMDHARNLAPDQDTFFKAIEAYARSSTSTRLILDTTRELIDADGVITDEEFNWAEAMRDAFAEAKSGPLDRRADELTIEVRLG